PLVAENIVLQQKDLKLKALIHPDMDAAKQQGLSDADLEKIIEEYRIDINKDLPAYSQIASVAILPDEFEKTPKRSIKRFLYQDSL
ncbi:MAG: long-chain fatty acid--CoA ligase, partial [Bacteroidales bacterium]|nr:long-chain fatty acid--CoA ligase [Bacteroidales bacterium]